MGAPLDRTAQAERNRPDQIPSSPSLADNSSGDGAEATFASQRALSQISIVSMTPMITTSRAIPAR